MTAVVKAWDDNSLNARSVIDDILQCLFVHCPSAPNENVLLTNRRFHPDFQNHASQIQREMLACVRMWLQSLGHQQSTVLTRLSKQAVRNHQNVRLGGAGSVPVSQSHGQAGTSGQGNVPNLLQGIPGMGHAQGLYNQFSGGAGAGREGFGSTMGTVPVPETGPPPVPVSPRPVGGTAAGFFGDSPASQSYPPPPAYPGPPLASPTLPQPSSPRPALTSSPYHGHGHGYPSPTKPGFPGAPDQPPYVPPSSGFPGPASQPPYVGGPPRQELPYAPGSSYPGQSLYPGQPSTGYVGMPESGGRYSPSYDQPPNPPSSFPGTAPSFPQSGPGFPDASNAQPGSGYGSVSYGKYGQY